MLQHLKKPWAVALFVTVVLFAASFAMVWVGDPTVESESELSPLPVSGWEKAMVPLSALLLFLALWALLALLRKFTARRR